MRRSLILPLLLSAACGVEGVIENPKLGDVDAPGDDIASTSQAVTCAPKMSVFPVAAAHNIGYDARSCGTGRCEISCPDANANSDWSAASGHHGIDVFAFQRAPLVAVANGTVVAVGRPSSTSGLRVRIRDACGWEYYYGHMDEAVVAVGQSVGAGQLLGYMGRTGTASTHLHFNVSPNGAYYSDINPFNLLASTSATACGPTPDPEPQPQPPPAGCGVLPADTGLAVDQSVTSCDGRFALTMQSDGNLVLYQAGVGALWASWTNGSSADQAVMQSDGNFVIYGQGAAVWHTHTYGRNGAYLAVQNDGNVVIYQGSTPIWSSGTCCR